MLFVALLAASNTVFSQQSEIDRLKASLQQDKVAESVVKTKNELSKLYINLNPDSALKFANEALVEARKLGLEREEVLAMSNSANAFAKKGREMISVDLNRDALLMLKSIKDDTLSAYILVQQGILFSHQADYDSALIMLFDALDIYEEVGDAKKLAGTLNSIGNVYYFTQKGSPQTEAEKYYTEALEMYLKLKDKEGLAKQYGNLGLIYGNRKEWPKAIEYSQKSLQYYKEVGKKTGIATSYVNLGYVYMETGNYTSALENLKQALEIRQSIGDRKGVAIATGYIGSVYLQKGDYARAKTEITQALELSEEIGLRVTVLENMSSLAEVEKQLGNYKVSADLYKQAYQLRDTLFNEELADKMNEIASKYEIIEQKDKIKMLEGLNTANENQMESVRHESEIKDAYLSGAIVILLLLWIILGVSYWAYRSKMKSNELLALQNEEITRQKEEIVDSINYAQTIQNAILPPASQINELLPHSFVLFKPKDVVSGDFYWTEKVENRIYFAAVDCTGHGVPGAFMSIIGNNCLMQCIKDYKLKKPSGILDKMVVLVLEALRSEVHTSVKDGMDMALCCYYPDEGKLEFAGAYNPLYLVRKGELIVYKADRQPIGNHDNRKPFTNHEVELEKGDSIYLFSDGFADQFGGPNDKKFSSKKMKDLLVALADKTPAEQHRQLEQTFVEWKGDGEQTDDVTIMGVMV